jgi:hypothetical protein
MHSKGLRYMDAPRFGESMASNVINIRTGPANAPVGQATTLHADALTLEFQRPDTPVRIASRTSFSTSSQLLPDPSEGHVM